MQGNPYPLLHRGDHLNYLLIFCNRYFTACFFFCPPLSQAITHPLSTSKFNFFSLVIANDWSLVTSVNVNRQAYGACQQENKAHYWLKLWVGLCSQAKTPMCITYNINTYDYYCMSHTKGDYILTLGQSGSTKRGRGYSVDMIAQQIHRKKVILLLKSRQDSHHPLLLVELRLLHRMVTFDFYQILGEIGRE